MRTSRIILTALAVAALVGSGVELQVRRPGRLTIIRAQTVPVNVRLQWDANPPADNVTSYTAQLDAEPPIAVTPPATEAILVVNTFGVHAFQVTATNQWGTSPPAVLTVLIARPGPPTNPRATKAP